MYVNVNGVLQKVSKVRANVNGAIKTIKAVCVNDNGTLRNFIAPGVTTSLLGTGWEKESSDTYISVNTSTQLKFYTSFTWESGGAGETTARVRRAIAIPAGARVHLTGTVKLGGSDAVTGWWEVRTTGSSTSVIGQGTLSGWKTFSISETFLAPEAATSLSLYVNARANGSSARTEGDFSEIQLLT